MELGRLASAPEVALEMSNIADSNVRLPDWQNTPMPVLKSRRSGVDLRDTLKQWDKEDEDLAAQNKRLRRAIRALIEGYVPHEHKAVLLREHLKEQADAGNRLRRKVERT